MQENQPVKRMTFSDLTTSSLGLSVRVAGRFPHINQHLDEKSQPVIFDLLDRAYHLGIRYFVPADELGEQFLGKWLFKRAYNRACLTTAARWAMGDTKDQQPVIDQDTTMLIQRLSAAFVWSCLRLGQTMSVYQIALTGFASAALNNSALLHRLAEIKDDGRLIGVAVSGPRQSELIEQVMAIECNGSPLFDLVQANWSVLDTSLSKALQCAKSAGLSVVLDLTRTNDQTQHKKLQQIAGLLNYPVEQLTMAAALNQPWADRVLSEANTQEQLNAHYQALTLPWQRVIQPHLSNLIDPS